MTSLFAKASLAILLSLGTLSAVAPAAQASGWDVDVAVRHHRKPLVVVRDHRQPVVVRDHRQPLVVVRDHRQPVVVIRDHRQPVVVVRDHRQPVYVEDRIVVRDHRGQCSPWAATEKARWQGFHRAEVTRIGPNRVVVSGMRNWRWDNIVFANVRGCPIIRY